MKYRNKQSDSSDCNRSVYETNLLQPCAAVQGEIMQECKNVLTVYGNVEKEINWKLEVIIPIAPPTGRSSVAHLTV